MRGGQGEVWICLEFSTFKFAFAFTEALGFHRMKSLKNRITTSLEPLLLLCPCFFWKKLCSSSAGWKRVVFWGLTWTFVPLLLNQILAFKEMLPYLKVNEGLKVFLWIEKHVSSACRNLFGASSSTQKSMAFFLFFPAPLFFLFPSDISVMLEVFLRAVSMRSQIVVWIWDYLHSGIAAFHWCKHSLCCSFLPFFKEEVLFVF